MGEDQFQINPVGAGPFKVVSDQLNSQLVLERNADYFVPDRPYLDKLTIRSIGGDQPAYQALLAGQGQAYEGMTTIPLLDQAKKNNQLVVTQQPATSPYVIQLNTKIAAVQRHPGAAGDLLRDQRRRDPSRACSRARTRPASRSPLTVACSITQTVPGYRTFDLDKAKALVQQLGGLTVDLGTLSAYVADQVNTALQTQWQAAGIKVTIHSEQLNGLVQNFVGGKWQAMLQTAGAWDPAVGVGVGFRFGTRPHRSAASVTRPSTTCCSRPPQTTDAAQRDSLYLQVGQRISDQAYAPFILAFAPASVVTKNVHGPGLTTLIPPVVVNTGILWDEVWMSKT